MGLRLKQLQGGNTLEQITSKAACLVTFGNRHRDREVDEMMTTFDQPLVWFDGPVVDYDEAVVDYLVAIGEVRIAGYENGDEHAQVGVTVEFHRPSRFPWIEENLGEMTVQISGASVARSAMSDAGAARFIADQLLPTLRHAARDVGQAEYHEATRRLMAAHVGELSARFANVRARWASATLAMADELAELRREDHRRVERPPCRPWRRVT